MVPPPRARPGVKGPVLRVQPLEKTKVISAVTLLAGLVGACGKDPPPPPPAAEVAVSAAPCPNGRSDDPPRAELVKAHRLFRGQQYAEARALLDRLLEQKPHSATALAARGDATLFDDSLGYADAARRAREYYDRATNLVAQGCGVSRRTEYYLHMGDAFAALRLAPTDGGAFDRAELDRADAALRRAEERWPQSAEVLYNQARVQCARGDVDPCLERFSSALEAAGSLERPRFLRTHRSTEDWIVRSETQSEFGALREDPRYRAVIEEARARLKTRPDAGPAGPGASPRRRGPERGLRLRPDSRPPAQTAPQ